MIGGDLYHSSDRTSSPKGGKYSSWEELFYFVAILTTLTFAWLYLAGWQFAAHYLKGFQFGPSGADIAFDFLPLLGLRVPAHYPLAALVGGILVFVTLWLVGPSDIDTIPAKWSVPAAALVIIVAFWLGFRGGKTAGEHHFRQLIADNYLILARVRVLLKPSGDDVIASDSGVEHPALGCHRLLLENEQSVFLVRPRHEEKNAVLPVVTIPRQNIATLIILTQRGNCT